MQHKPQESDSDIVERVRRRMEAREMKDADLARALAVEPQVINNWWNRERIPAERHASIARALAWSLDEMVFGEPPAIREEGLSYVTDETHVFVNRVSGVALSAGPGFISFEHEELDSSHAFTKSWMRSKGLKREHCKIIEVTGDSMAPYALDGDVVLVNLEQNKLRSGEIFAINVDGEIRIKRLIRRADGCIEIRSDNESPKYPAETLCGPDIDKLKIIGMVRWRGG